MKRALLALLLLLAAPPLLAWEGLSISDVTPRSGLPTGGALVRISARNASSPVRVFFDFGAERVEAIVVSVSPSGIDIITPAVNLRGQQRVTATIIVYAAAGLPNEQRASLENAFVFQNERLTPKPIAASPNRGPIQGGTRVTIFGEGFQAPVQVLFGSIEARIIYSTYDQIIVETPNGSSIGTAVPVDIIVNNISAQTGGVLREGFRYAPDPIITAIAPTSGPASGGTLLRIATDLWPPVMVTVGGVPAEVIRYSEGELVVKTGATHVAPCSAIAGQVVVISIVDGAIAAGPAFTYFGPRAYCGFHHRFARP